VVVQLPTSVSAIAVTARGACTYRLAIAATTTTAAAAI